MSTWVRIGAMARDSAVWGFRGLGVYGFRGVGAQGFRA